MVTKRKSEKAAEWWADKLAQRKAATFVGETISELSSIIDSLTRIKWPSDTFRRYPVKFFTDILGVDPWSKQVEILEAIRDHPRVAVRSGHKIGKSKTAAGAGLWFYSSWDDARVVMTSTTSRQVDQILWREVKMLKARGGRCVACQVAMHRMAENVSMQQAEQAYPRPCEHSAMIDGEIGEQARTGLKSVDFREIVGFTAREAEAVAGISGSNLLYLPDEASGIAQVIFDAIEGNRAGGARLAMFSNPTKNDGEFYDAFHTKKDLYKTITVSSAETPNVVQGVDNLIPGLANKSWITEKAEEWGEDSALFKIRVKGEHAEHEEGKAFSVHTIQQAELRHADTEAEGRLCVGIDPAGPTGKGDESYYSARRGLKQIRAQGHRGLKPETHIIHLLAMINQLKVPREVPVVLIDREGKIGAELYGAMLAFLETPRGKNAFELVAVRASDRAMRESHIYDRVRDELASNLENWFREGGAIITDTKLAAELHVFEWKESHNGRMKITDKETVRKKLGRSPDRFDALCLSVWEPSSIDTRVGALPVDVRDLAPDPMDPYAAPAIDPYASGSYGRS